MMKKKSQIFLLDVIFSIVIIIVAVGIVFTYFSTTFDNDEIYSLNYQILNSITSTKINSLNNQEVRDLFISGDITNIENTVAQQIGEYFHEGKIGLAQNLTEIFIKNYINKQMNFEINIYNESSNLVLYDYIKKTKNDAQIMTKTKRDIFGFINRTTSYGPYTVQVEIWV